MNLRDLRIGTRLTLGFGSIILIGVALVVVSTLVGKRGREELRTAMEAAAAKEALASAMKNAVLERSSALRMVNLQGSIEGIQKEAARAESLGKAYGEARERMLRLNLGTEEKRSIEALGRLDRDLDAPVKEVVEMSLQFRSEEASRKLIDGVDPTFQKAVAEIDRLLEMQRANSREALAAADAAGNRLTMIALFGLAGVLAIAVGIAWVITRSITGPLGESVSVARRVATGDLTSHIQAAGRDETAQLLLALREMNDGLARMVVQIRTGAESIAVGAGEVSAGNQSLASRTEEHASSLEETASTLEEFTSTVKQNADHARQASQLAAAAAQVAQKGGAVVSSIVETMGEVTSSSKKISDIIAVIDGIAFQTNILALNAAVEAARAGEQGRGFAVVAAEVRNLAQRSAGSAKEIRGLIENSVGRIETSARLVDQAGKTMEELVSTVQRVSELMGEIAAASNEQSSGIEQINKAITQMDRVVQMNASLVQEASAAATSMENQAGTLSRTVAQFRVAGHESPAALTAPTPAAATLPAAASAPAPAAASARRSVIPAGTGDDDWKEF
jgi:methyl-accepting chemotaxis protein